MIKVERCKRFKTQWRRAKGVRAYVLAGRLGPIGWVKQSGCDGDVRLLPVFLCVMGRDRYGQRWYDNRACRDASKVST